MRSRSFIAYNFARFSDRIIQVLEIKTKHSKRKKGFASGKDIKCSGGSKGVENINFQSLRWKKVNLPSPYFSNENIHKD